MVGVGGGVSAMSPKDPLRIFVCPDCARESKWSTAMPKEDVYCIYCAGEVPAKDDPDLQDRGE